MRGHPVQKDIPMILGVQPFLFKGVYMFIQIKKNKYMYVIINM